MAGGILVIGDVINDIVVKPFGPIARGTDTRATIRHTNGGSGANQAAWLAALGAEVRFAARVGSTDKNRLTAYFSGLGVEPCLAADDDLPTGQIVCLIDPDGERSFLTDRGANAQLDADDLPPSLLDGIEIVHISGYALFEPGARAAVLDLVAIAKQRDIAVSIDPASTAFLAEVGRADFIEWTRGADFLFPNADEAALLTGKIARQEQWPLLLADYQTVVLKFGGDGALLATRDAEPISKPAKSVVVQDTTGAGDAFLAGFLAARLRGEAPEACLELAIHSGARAVTNIGAQPF